MLLLALAKYDEPVDITVLQFADEMHLLFKQQRDRFLRALRYACSVRTQRRRHVGRLPKWSSSAGDEQDIKDLARRLISLRADQVVEREKGKGREIVQRG